MGSEAVSMLHTLNWSATDNTNPYVAAADPYDAVAYMRFGGYTGSGTLVQSTTAGQFKFLTAAHNVDFDADGTIDTATFDLYFGDNTGARGGSATASVTVGSSNVAVNSLWTTGDGSLSAAASQYDFAVLTFGAPAVTGTLPVPMTVSMMNPLGLTGTMVGYGAWGNGNSYADNNPDGVRRAADNVLDVVGEPGDSPGNTGFTIQSDFDNGTAGVNSIGTTTALALEGTTAGGDSGGPIVVNGNVVGVLNGGFSGAGGKKSEYGDRSIWAWSGEASNLSFLQANGVLVIPEPSVAVLAALGGLVFMGRRR